MRESLIRMSGVFLRYMYLHKRSLPRTLEIFFWPVMELLVWGFVSVYVRSLAPNAAANAFVFLINAMIFWDILYRSQQSVSISVIEDVWTGNITNVLVSPLRLVEWIGATFLYGLVKTAFITAILAALAIALYRFNVVSELGIYAVPLVSQLLLFGWALGIFTAGLVIRYGYAAEALIWGIPFLIQPLSAIYYPLSILPPPLRAVSRCLPSTYVFEGMREVLATHSMPIRAFAIAAALNLVYFALGALFFRFMFERARDTGRLGRLGMD